MKDETHQEKTLDPTQHRIEEAKKKGDVPVSKDVVHWFVFGSGALFIFFLLPYVLPVTRLLPFLGRAHDLAPGYIYFFLKESLLSFGVLFFLIFSVILATLIQTQGLINFEHLKPKLEKFSIQSSLKKVFSKASLVDFLKSMINTSILIGLIWIFVIRPLTLQSYQYLSFSLKEIVLLAQSNIGKVFIIAVCVFFLIAVIDYLLQRYRFLQKLKMSHQETKEELKETEGNPHIRSRIKQIRQSKAQRYMMKEVPKATVVLTNPTHYAVALFWKEDMAGAPKVIAKGLDYLALKIKESAKEHNVPVVENPSLAKSIYETVPLNQAIPPNHYKAVAEIIRFVLSIKKTNRPLVYS